MVNCKGNIVCINAWKAYRGSGEIGPLILNPLTPNDPYRGRTAPLTSKRCILYIYSTNIGTEYFKHDIYSPFFSLQNAVCFIILKYLFLYYSYFIYILYIFIMLKLKKKSGAKRLTSTLDGGKWLVSRADRFVPGQNPGTYCVGGRVKPITGLDDFQMKIFHSNPEPCSSTLCRAILGRNLI